MKVHISHEHFHLQGDVFYSSTKRNHRGPGWKSGGGKRATCNTCTCRASALFSPSTGAQTAENDVFCQVTSLGDVKREVPPPPFAPKTLSSIRAFRDMRTSFSRCLVAPPRKCPLRSCVGSGAQSMGTPGKRRRVRSLAGKARRAFNQAISAPGRCRFVWGRCKSLSGRAGHSRGEAGELLCASQQVRLIMMAMIF